ncbi:glycosyltransferase family 4 protein [Syntrophaceticus schinkii]|uniref:Glycosyl transferase group 1 n=1 Tax=Syntrophaceticus schinkii TaxID=499207 RepID=A0A0B7MIG8_9FIRM|nr:glycosyltransferase family 4 protein [Syntrophaceticus schinkii]CEO88028.1 Glycosyl transferase group 1 [Syntrophaceticus schinkii]
MRILITLDTDWIRRNPAQHHHISERLVIRGHEVRVIDYEVLWSTEGEKELYSRKEIYKDITKIFSNAGVTVVRPGIVKIPLLDYASMLVTYEKEINNQIDDFKPDVIIGHGLLSNYLALKSAKKNKIPHIDHIIDVNSTLIPFKFLHPLGRRAESIVAQGSDCVIVINEVLKDYAVSIGADPDKIHVIRAGIDPDRYNTNIDGTKIRDKYSINRDDIVLFFMGWLYNFSGLKEIIKEFSKIVDKKPNIKLLIVGDGDAFLELQKIISDYSMDKNVIMVGRQPFEKIPEHIASSDICLLPAYNNEVMRNIVPIKLYEYMAVGKPVISTKLPGVMKEFGENNGVVYVDQPEDVIAKAIYLVRNDLLCELGQRARKFVAQNSWEKITDAVETLLADVAKSGGQRNYVEN